MSDPADVVAAVIAGVRDTSPLEAASVALGLAYSVLAVGRSRWCWITGGASSAILIYLALIHRLPMQAALQVYYVVISAYGWWHWSREEQARGTLAVSVWPLSYHVGACVAVVAVSVLNARWLAGQTQAAWPFLDSLSTWGSLYATWLTARVKLENWLYWIAIDSLLAFLFGAQGLYFVALLSVVYLGVSTVGFLRWLKIYRMPATAL
ncbi:MAG TPA: nicotinamide riboside transporter PnuC [Steroidobacteraceae bacterium]|nr:nicotinamide riboside transporter PnuC [Steroidobacteraceae bacterium]